MNKKALLFVATLFVFSTLAPQFSIATSNPGQIYEGEASLIYRNVTVYAPAVASTDDGYVGVISTITVTIQSNGSGRVFVDTLPLTQVDMQGSARLAVKVASALVKNDENCDANPEEYDYFFVVRTTAPVIGGPSAGAIMTVATISLLENWAMDNETVMTGMINPDASIGPIGGIPQKIDAANSVGAKTFLIPRGQGTYTEFEGGIFATPVTKSVADYAMNNYGITVVEVTEIDDAVEHFTGYTFETNESNGEISTQNYLDSMEPLARHLLENASEMWLDASEKFNESNIPNYFPTYNREFVDDKLEAAKTALTESQKWYNKNLYYTSTSKSFQSLINSRFVNYACEYDTVQDSSYLEELLDEVELLYTNASNEAKNAEINGFITLQSVGAAQRRASEAKTYFDLARASYDNQDLSTFSDVLDFLYEIAFVYERSNSIGWWINIGTHFTDIGEIGNSTIENLALEYIEEAEQSSIYSNVIIDEMGSSYYPESVRYLNTANDLIDSARDNLEKDYPAAALFEALEGLVKANLAIEIIGVDAEDRIDIASDHASSNIAKSRKQGIEPVLAVSYYEYAESLANESSYDNALVYYKYSGMIAGAITFTNMSTGTSSSRYVGIPEYGKPNLGVTINSAAIGIALLIGGIGGLGLGLIIASRFVKKEEIAKTKATEQQIEYQETEKYRNPYFSKEEMPRSIKDYYKKKK